MMQQVSRAGRLDVTFSMNAQYRGCAGNAEFWQWCLYAAVRHSSTTLTMEEVQTRDDVVGGLHSGYSISGTGQA
jgi:hypothetical protein